MIAVRRRRSRASRGHRRRCRRRRPGTRRGRARRRPPVVVRGVVAVMVVMTVPFDELLTSCHECRLARGAGRHDRERFSPPRRVISASFARVTTRHPSETYGFVMDVRRSRPEVRRPVARRAPRGRHLRGADALGRRRPGHGTGAGSAHHAAPRAAPAHPVGLVRPRDARDRASRERAARLRQRLDVLRGRLLRDAVLTRTARGRRRGVARRCGHRGRHAAVQHERGRDRPDRPRRRRVPARLRRRTLGRRADPAAAT